MQPITFGSLFAGIGGIDLGQPGTSKLRGGHGRNRNLNEVLAAEFTACLTPAISEWMMSFPLGWTQTDCDAAVVPQVAEWIGRRIVSALQGESKGD